MLINYIRVYQLSGSPSNIVGQASGNSNLTGAGGAVAVNNDGGDQANSAITFALYPPQVYVQLLLALVMAFAVYPWTQHWQQIR